MKKLSKIFTFVFFIMALFTLAGCATGGEIDTKLEISKDFKGERYIEVELIEESIEEYFSGSIEDIDKIAGENCPDDMEYSFLSSETENKLIFKIKFDSLEEYEEKIGNILNGNSDYVSYEAADSVWSKGFYIQENFNSENLLECLKEAIVESGMIDSSNASYIFESRNTQVVYEGTIYVTSATIYHNDVEYINLSEIDVLTEINEDTFNRKVDFYIPLDSLDKDKKKELKAYFEDTAKSTLKVSESENANYVIYSLSLEGLNAEKLKQFDETLFGEANVLTEDVETGDIFSFTTSFSESISLDKYLFSPGQYVIVNTLVKVPEDYSLGNSTLNLKGKEGFSTKEDYPGFSLLRAEYATKSNISDLSFAVAKSIKIKELDINTRIMGKDSFSKEFVITPEREFSDEEFLKISEAILKRLEEADYDEEASASENSDTDLSDTLDETDFNLGSDSSKTMSVALVKDDENQVGKLTVSFKGNAECIENLSKALLKKTVRFVYGEKRNPLSIKYKKALSENFDTSELIKSVTSDYIVNYRINMGIGSTIEECNLDKAVIDKNIMEVKGNNITGVLILAKSINIRGILIWAFMALGLVFIFLAVLFNLILKERAKKKEEERMLKKAQKKTSEKLRKDAKKSQKKALKQLKKESKKTQKETSKQLKREAKKIQKKHIKEVEKKAKNEAIPETSSKCPKCGADRVLGNRFCTNCGYKFEE